MWVSRGSLPGQGGVDGAGGEHDQGEGCLGGVEPERASHDEPDPLVEALESGVAQTQTDRGQDPFAVLADGASGLDKRLEPAALRPGAPAVEQPDGFSLGQVNGEDRSKRFLSVGTPQCPAVASDRLEGLSLPVGEVLRVLEQCPAGTFELVGDVGIGQAAQAAARSRA